MSDSAFTPRASKTDHRDASALQQGVSAARRGLTTVGFWTAVILPFVHVPLLLNGLETAADLHAFTALVGANLVALLVGRQYGT